MVILDDPKSDPETSKIKKKSLATNPEIQMSQT